MRRHICIVLCLTITERRTSAFETDLSNLGTDEAHKKRKSKSIHMAAYGIRITLNRIDGIKASDSIRWMVPWIVSCNIFMYCMWPY